MLPGAEQGASFCTPRLRKAATCRALASNIQKDILLITSHDLLSSFVKFQLIAHLLHRCSECFNLLLLQSELCLKGFLLPSKLRREVLLLLRDGRVRCSAWLGGTDFN